VGADLVTPDPVEQDEELVSTYCGSFSPDDLSAHLDECGVCARDHEG